MASRLKSDRFSGAGRFDDGNEIDPLGGMANLVDLMLVFACGLIAALVARTDVMQQLQQPSKQQTSQRSREPVAVERGRELPQLPPQLQGDGSGMENVGRVYRDPKTGKLILIGE